MPHLTFEYSPNVQTEWKTLFAKLHKIVVELTGTDISNCKSRAYCTNQYLVGDNLGNDFVHLNVAILRLRGKSKEEIQTIGNAIKGSIVAHLGDSVTAKMQITVEMRDIPNDFYFKHIG